MSYSSAVYHEIGGKTLVVSSSGEIQLEGNMDIESGAVCEVKSGGEIEVESGGIIDFESGAKMKMAVDVFTTASTGTLQAQGMSVFSSTKTADSLSMAAPVAGMFKWLYCSNATATGYVAVNVGGTGRTYDGSNYIYQFKAANTWVALVCQSTSRWREVYRSSTESTSINDTST